MATFEEIIGLLEAGDVDAAQVAIASTPYNGFSGEQQQILARTLAKAQVNAEAQAVPLAEVEVPIESEPLPEPEKPKAKSRAKKTTK